MKYRGAGEGSGWDFALDTEHRPVDVSLMLPHYRARNQPLDHRLTMFVGSDLGESIKVKVVSASPAHQYINTYTDKALAVPQFHTHSYHQILPRSAFFFERRRHNLAAFRLQRAYSPFC